MSLSGQRFIRCRHCGLPHEARVRRCPVTQGSLERSGPALIAEAPATKHGDPAQATPPRDQLLERRYRVGRLIGQGAMGAVYAAEHVLLRRPVAIKVLLTQHPSGSVSARRFRREARIACSLDHPNLLKYHDVGRLADGSLYLVMELLEGRSLREVVRGGPVAVPEALEIARQVLEGLAAAHARDVVHRDLKPDNVFLTGPPGSRVVKVLDFGISKRVVADDTALTGTGELIGTPRYLAPEQIRGGAPVDRRADLWACGIMLHEMLTGDVPFTSPHLLPLLTQILEEPTPLPSAARPELPGAIDHLVLCALQKDRRARFDTAAAMLQALRRAASECQLLDLGATQPSVAPIHDVADETPTLDLGVRRASPADDDTEVMER